jgi:23S rRNA (adenine2503-C2)-methyltransferase
MKNLLDFTKEELKKEMKLLGLAEYNALQLFQWVQSGVTDWDQMTNLSKKHREMLAQHYTIDRIRPVKVLEDSKDHTKKYLFALPDGHIIETVLMHYHYGYSICISSQVGCAMGCSFCASTLDGLQRDLTAGEMVDQIMTVETMEGIRIGNVVIMGSGEPLDNFAHTVRFIHMVNDEDGLNKGQRHLSISTCGLVPEILKLAELDLQINLSVSLHAPNDLLRRQMMPIAKRYSLQVLLEACQRYEQKTNRRITYEYAMIKKVNDSEQHARELADLLKGMKNSMVNLIPVNEIKENAYESSDEPSIALFCSILSKSKVPYTVRRKLGTQIEAACGQLRKGYLDETGANK